MVKLVASIKAELENVDALELDETMLWFKLSCSSCRELQKAPVAIDSTEEMPIQGSRGTANLVMKCGFCGKAMNVSFDTSFKPKPYTADEASSQNFAKVAQFECRGCELVEFLPLQSKWRCQGTTGATFADISLEDWTDFDEQAREPVSIAEVQTKISRA